MLKNMKIGMRLGLGFGAVLLIFVAAVVITSYLLMGANASAKLVEDETLPFLMRAYELDVKVTQVSEALTDVAATHNMDGLKEAEKAAGEVRKILSDL